MTAVFTADFGATPHIKFLYFKRAEGNLSTLIYLYYMKMLSQSYNLHTHSSFSKRQNVLQLQTLDLVE